jgi:NADH:ubiquinone oxidoreductase subunit K
MYFGDINIFIIVFIIILSSVCINVSSALHLLLTAEILWITLYFLTLAIGMSYDNLNLLSLTFFFLVLSAVEFGIGLVLLLVQNIFFRSLSLSDSQSDFNKFSTRFSSRIKSSFIPFI